MNLKRALVVGFVALGCLSAFDAGAQGADPSSESKRYPWDLRPKKCFAPGASAVPSCAAQPDWPNYYEASSRAGQLIAADWDFDLIQRAETELGFSRAKFPSGEYYFEAWFGALDGMFRMSGEYAYKIRDGWAGAKGEGGYLKLVDALLRYGEALAARGSGYGNTVMPEGRDIYFRKMREANQTLESAPRELKEMGPWWVVKLRVAYQLPELEDSRADLLESASKAWPDYTSIYSTAANFSLPRWGGTYDEVDRIARLAVARSKARMGAALYPAVYDKLFSVPCDCTLADSAVDWKLMKQGFRDAEAQGRTDFAHWQQYANLACQMRDRDEARRLLDLSDKLRTRPRGAEPPNACREFAFAPT